MARARAAQPEWNVWGIRNRVQVKRRFQQILLAHKIDVARRITQEAGKPAVEALLTEVLVVLDAARFLIDNAFAILREEKLPHGNPVMKTKSGRILHEPYGVIGIISPWNYPFSIPATETLAALVAGNAVVLKPSELTPLIALELQALLREAGVPDDIFQVLPGEGATGAALVGSEIDKLVFTGSVGTGRRIAQIAAGRLLPVVLELGGKDPMLVLEDADVDVASSGDCLGGVCQRGADVSVSRTLLRHQSLYWIAVQDHFHDLVLATYGRGFWILDDLTPLEQMTPQVADASAYLFPARDAYRFRTTVQPEAPTYDATAGQNAPYGASINYFLKSAPQSDVRFAILDASGRTVRTLTGSKEAGVNRITWDLRFTPTREMRLRTSPEYAPEIAEGPEGWRPAPGAPRISVLAPPGAYTVKMTVDGKDYTQKLTVRKDPHSNGTEGDIQVQTKLINSLSDEMNGMVDVVNQIELIRAQLTVLEAELGSDQSATAIRTAADQLNAKLVEVEDNIVQLKATGRGQDTVRWTPKLTSKMGYLANEVGSSDDQPTTQQVAVHDELKESAATHHQRLRNLLGKDVADFNTLLRQRNVPNIVTNVGEQASKEQ